VGRGGAGWGWACLQRLRSAGSYHPSFIHACCVLLNPYTLHLWLDRSTFTVGGSPCQNGHMNLSFCSSVPPTSRRWTYSGCRADRVWARCYQTSHTPSPPTSTNNHPPTNHRRQITTAATQSTDEKMEGNVPRPQGVFYLVRCTLPCNPFFVLASRRSPDHTLL
jgi:hypothetical protein